MMQPTRRDVLRAGICGVGAAGLGGFAFGRVAIKPSISDDNILVVVQLTGGNDGLNTIVPIDNDAYNNARPTIGLKRGLHPIGGGLALNSGMTAFKELFDDGKLAIINGCGYPRPNRSHYRAMEIWHTANPLAADPSGWLSNLPAINIGTDLPQALFNDRLLVPTFTSIDDFRARRPRVKCPDTAADYPGGVGQHLKLIAQLITADMGTRVFYCQTGSFDAHANQLGQHERLLNNASTSIETFMRDIRAKGVARKVTVMCFSEFGRRVKQNHSAGTDHGTAGPMFVVGEAVNGGLYGKHPSLTDLDDGDLKYTTDFRRVYATVLDRWLNRDSTTILNNAFEPLAFL